MPSTETILAGATSRTRCDRCDAVREWLNMGDGRFRCGVCGDLRTLQVPCDAAREAGYHIARLMGMLDVDAFYAANPDAPRMCADCAFRVGSEPNGSPEAILTAIRCAVTGEEFSCHHGLDGKGEATRLCAGWVISQAK